MSNITIKKGNPYTATITVTDEGGNAYDLTGKTVFFTVKKISDKTAADTSALITKDISSHTNPSGGITTLSLTTSQTNIAVGVYKWDIRIYSASPAVQLNSDSGYCEVEDVVTKRTS